MTGRPKIAFYWCAGCGGCDESVIDLAEGLLIIQEMAEIVFWPLAMDSRYRDVEDLADGAIDAAFINGAVRLEEHVRMARLLRRKSKRIIALGTCAHMGGVVGLANLHTPRQLLECAYRQVPSMADPQGPLPGDEPDRTGLSLTGLLPGVQTLDQVVAVDAFIPGCPPPPEIIGEVISDIIDGCLPETGTVFAERKALCNQCARLDTRPAVIEIDRFKRLHDTCWEPDVCFLPQGLICMGPVTRGGCNARCIDANMPCRGCFGPTEAIADFGAGAIAFIAAIMTGSDETALKKLVKSIPDATGLLYRYALATSVLGKGNLQ